jgi:hypothetical protein
MALERAGFAVESYRTDPQSEADEQTLQRRLAQGDVAILLTASVFGSSALLPALAAPEWRALVERQRVHVIVDLCQDLWLTARLPLDYGSRLSAIVSFNDKSIPGLMGGGLLTALGRPEASERLSWTHSRVLVAMGRAKLRAALGRGDHRRSAVWSDESPFEFSRCAAFPYGFDTSGVSKLQIVTALVGLANRGYFARAKQAWLTTCAEPPQVPHVATAPYLVMSSSRAEPGRRRKRPYALHGQSQESLRPHQVIVHNKGFADLTQPSEVHG